MRVVILGAGQVGSSIARYLATEDNHITIVDQSESVLQKISDSMDVQPVVGSACHPQTLAEAGVDGADLLVAVTQSDEVNIVACEVSNSLFKVNKKVARIRNQNYLNPKWIELFAPNHLAVDVVISPEVEVAKAIARSIQVAGSFDVISLLGGYVKAIGVKCQTRSPILNAPLKMLPTLFPKLDIFILSISRNGSVFIPNADTELKEGDEVYFMVQHTRVLSAMEAFGLVNPQDLHIVVMGAGNIGLTLAMHLEETQPNVQVKLIEKSQERAEIAAKHLKNIEILCGDGLDYEILTEASIQKAHMAVSVTQDDKVNILSGLFAKRHGAQRSLTLLNKMDYASLVTSLGIDSIINPRSVTVSTILQHIRQGRVQSIHTMFDGYAEILEIYASDNASVIGFTVEDINLSNSIMVATIMRGDNIYISPPYKTIIQPRDYVIMVVAKHAVHKVEKLFGTRPKYL